MIYDNYDRSVSDMAWWVNYKHIPKEKLTLGIGFHNYSAVLAAYPNAWAVDTVGGGTFRNGTVMNYQGEASVAKITQLSAQYGGAMIWETQPGRPNQPAFAPQGHPEKPRPRNAAHPHRSTTRPAR